MNTSPHKQDGRATLRFGEYLGAGSVLLCALAVIFSGCGPVQSTQRIHQAEIQFEKARVAGAHEKAPYEYYTAQNYLYKSKEEWGYSDFEASVDYARKAFEEADAAILKAKEDPWAGSPVEDKQQEEALAEDDDAAKEKVPTGF